MRFSEPRFTVNTMWNEGVNFSLHYQLPVDSIVLIVVWYDKSLPHACVSCSQMMINYSLFFASCDPWSYTLKKPNNHQFSNSFKRHNRNIKQKAQEPHRSPEQQLLYLWSYKHYLHYQNQNILKMSYSRSYTESNNNTDEFYEYIFTRPLFWFYYLWEYFPLFLYLKKFPLCGPTVLQEIMVWQDLIFTACVLTQVSAF